MKFSLLHLESFIRSEVNMASNMSYAPVLPRIDWSSRNLEEEHDNFEEIVDLMWTGPLCNAGPEERFGYVKVWSVQKSITLWRNSGKTEKNVKVLLDVIKSYCIPSDRRFWFARMEFRQLAQRPNESIQDFSSRIMTLSNTCDWANRDEQIVCGIICGAAHRDAQRKALLKDKSLTVRYCIEHFASYEATDAYHKTIVNPTSVSAVYINCFNCGHKHKKISSVNDNEPSHSDDESYFVNTIQDEEAHDTCVKLRFAGARRGISTAIDTGAGISVLPTRVYRIVFPHVTIQPTNIKLSAYNNTPINVVGKIEVSCKYNNAWKPLKFIVTDEHTYEER